MHELSIAENILDIIRQYVPAAERARVRRVFTIVGAQSGVVADSLEFSYQAITIGTVLERSVLTIEQVPFTLHCTTCGKDSVTETGSVHCVACGSTDTTVIAGTELRVREIELEDEQEGTP